MDVARGWEITPKNILCIGIRHITVIEMTLLLYSVQGIPLMKFLFNLTARFFYPLYWDQREPRECFWTVTSDSVLSPCDHSLLFLFYLPADYLYDSVIFSLRTNCVLVFRFESVCALPNWYSQRTWEAGAPGLLDFSDSVPKVFLLYFGAIINDLGLHQMPTEYLCINPAVKLISLLLKACLFHRQ